MKRSHLSDQQLWESVLVGKARAWDELVSRYGPLVYAVCRQVGISESDAADVFQHSWIALYENRFRLEDPTRIASWLLTTAKREALRYRQRQARLQSDDCLAERADERPLPDEELRRLELQARLELALRSIDRLCRDLLRAFFFAGEDQSYEQIAAAFHIAPNSLGAKRRRCLDKVRAVLIRLGYLEERK
ncbi:MAG TPA: sigma-70 family RNA polymerase sigma factor [candidate division Zixibacteria bacterium]|nr:sigma-70 family RNA polymerase sigma factor [candidate division Zixibacteria bacterium]MDD4918361.1 sigma-70 family RNA polymerase sigma factor [candidate division Zixibacteria bacterium]MDM7973303.1 sigma-70 family RNA polymerase sigma factor [candidate division Zixibacteria bacterium]HOD66317.1 sigma-70 family RNA polymerase sigma factor [candidate division Zixibacteria bacterium]HOZ07368.1 sigma-70 family RNA polymerase sigma factor [candidate division Zixibacteria bacterium]